MILDIHGIHYIGVGLSSVALIPQFIYSYRNNSLRHVSTVSLCCFMLSSMLLAYYTFTNTLVFYFYSTVVSFVCSLSLILLQLWQYYKRFREHVRTFEAKEPAPAPTPAPAPAPAPTPPVPIITKVQSIEEPMVENPLAVKHSL